MALDHSIPNLATGKPATSRKSLQITTRSLWGYDVDSLDIENDQDRQTIIARVFDAGTHEDKLAIIDFFDLETIKQALLNTAELQSSTISLTAIWLNLNPEMYRAFKRLDTSQLKHASF